MQLYQLEHALRAASAITGEKDFIVIGTGALLASFPQCPPELRVSTEVDLYPRYKPSVTDSLNAIGELSHFHETYGFWVDPVGPETAKLPPEWESRLLRFQTPNTGDSVGWCLEVHDLASSKLYAGREKDLSFIRLLFQNAFVSSEVFRKRVLETPAEPDEKTLALKQLALLWKLGSPR